MPPWMMSPTITVIMYIPSCLATTSKSAMEIIFPQIRQAIPSGEYLMADTEDYCNDNHLHLNSICWSDNVKQTHSIICNVALTT